MEERKERERRKPEEVAGRLGKASKTGKNQTDKRKANG
jgi:hypothetical protein